MELEVETLGASMQTRLSNQLARLGRKQIHRPVRSGPTAHDHNCGHPTTATRPPYHTPTDGGPKPVSGPTCNWTKWPCATRFRLWLWASPGTGGHRVGKGACAAELDRPPNWRGPSDADLGRWRALRPIRPTACPAPPDLSHQGLYLLVHLKTAGKHHLCMCPGQFREKLNFVSLTWPCFVSASSTSNTKILINN